MTENNDSTNSENEKRFTLAYSNDSEKSKWWAVRDGDITLWKEEVVYLLNQLYGENEQLRQVMGFLENDNTNDILEVLNSRERIFEQLRNENEQLKQQKPFLKIHDDYFIQYGDDRELFNLHKPSDIRSLIYLINRENGYDELECEYNEEGYGND